MELTAEQKEHYIKVANNICPNPECNSEDITGDFVEIDVGSCWQPCHCNECHWEWNDIYKLVDMEVTS